MSELENSHTEVDPPSSPANATGDVLDDPRVLAVVQEYMAELDLGRVPDRRGYVSRYPELAVAVGQCLDGLELVRAAGPRSSSAGADRAAANEPAPRALGDFQIIRELGRGGMGVVYEAVQLSLGRRVALKVLPFAATFDARQLQRFKNEAQAAALLHHTNIVPIYAVGCERGVHFYAMQLIEGHSMALLIRQMREQAGLASAEPEVKSASPKSASPKSASCAAGVSATGPYLGGVVPLATKNEYLRSTAGASLSITARAARGGDHYQKLARLMLQAADALEHAHQVGIVHRDIKPANLMIDPSGTLWVADFGLALFQAEASLTRTGDLVGTFRYMSPEQASGQRTAIDHRTDLYSLGATFYELLTLEPVFSGETRHELLYQILHGEPKAPRQINRAIPVELETIVLKALRKTPGERYASAAEFAEDLRRFLDHRPILARRPTVVDRLRKWSRRHPSIVVAGVLLLAGGLVALSVSTWMIAREQQKTADSLAALSVSNRMIAHEQQKTADALGREKQRANEAEDLFRQARQAVDVLVEVSEDELADKFSMVQTRKRMLQTALGFYQDFIEERRGDEASQADLTTVEQRVKGILRELELLRRNTQTTLLRKPIVIQELRLDEQQEQRTAELLHTWDEEVSDLRSELEALDEEGRRQRFIALAEGRERSVERVLSAEQRERLRQLALQAQGLWAFKEPEVVAALELTRGQRLAIRKIERELFEREPPHDHRHGPQDHGPPDRGPRDHGPPEHGLQDHGLHDRGAPDRGSHPRRPKLRDFQQALAKVLALLSTEQIERWHELSGTPLEGLFDMPFGEPSGPTPPEDCTPGQKPTD
ncbi:MAG TPA: protein kinase [Pirellulales bacterium]|nr:protein kinase [Pirellulales bacterium]